MESKKKELLEKYGRLDWDVSGATNEEKAKYASKMMTTLCMSQGVYKIVGN